LCLDDNAGACSGYEWSVSDDLQIIPIAAARADIIIRDSEIGVLEETPPTLGQTVLLARAVRALVTVLEQGTVQAAELQTANEAAVEQLADRRAVATQATKLLQFAQVEHLPVGWYWTTAHAEARLVGERNVCRMDRGAAVQAIGMTPSQVEDAVRARSGRKQAELEARIVLSSIAAPLPPVG
jgi:hypothetical protein